MDFIVRKVLEALSSNFTCYRSEYLTIRALPLLLQYDLLWYIFSMEALWRLSLDPRPIHLTEHVC